MAHEVIHDEAHDRFDLLIDGEVAGHIDYVVKKNDIHLTHTEVSSERRERGLAAELVEDAFRQIRDSTQYRIVPDCPYIQHWLTSNHDYDELLER